jgi:hypothetical protein
MERKSRRRFLAGLAAVPVLVAGSKISGAARGAVAAMRPGARGGSASVCAQCGSREHGMLDPACPAAPRAV